MFIDKIQDFMNTMFIVALIFMVISIIIVIIDLIRKW